MSEKTNQLLDYIGRFINQAVVNTKPVVKSRSDILHGSLTECEQKPIDVEECIPYINYVGKKKHSQLSGLKKAFEQIRIYFTATKKKCQSVVNKDRCNYIVVSLQVNIKICTPTTLLSFRRI